MKKIPTLDEFLDYGMRFIELTFNEDGSNYTQWLTGKYLNWEAADWHVFPNSPKKKRKILNWKSTLGRCCRYREPNETRKIKVNGAMTITERILRDG